MQTQQQDKQDKPTTKSQSFIQTLKLLTLLAILCCGIAYQIFISYNKDNERSKESAIKYALIGDIGGTNIRYQLVSFTDEQTKPIQIIKQKRLKVVDFQTFEASIDNFLSDILGSAYPSSAVVAIAGPVQQNTVSMPNIAKWGLLDGNKLAVLYNLSSFLIINDFQAASYGILTLSQNQLVKLNALDADPRKIRGVIGPGTGLGHSIIFHNSFDSLGFTVLPSQAGHSDAPFIDLQTSEYIQFLKTKLGPTIDLQKTFCGPSIPLMYEFYWNKLHSNITFIPKESPEIVQECIRESPDLVYEKVFELFMKLYSAAIANFMIQHMATGGVYLVGGLTKALVGKIKGTDILNNWKERHADMVPIIQKIPLLFSNQVDLGLKGSFYIAKRITSQNSSTNPINKHATSQDIF